jgi:hypothetical protein
MVINKKHLKFKKVIHDKVYIELDNKFEGIKWMS